MRSSTVLLISTIYAFVSITVVWASERPAKQYRGETSRQRRRHSAMDQFVERQRTSRPRLVEHDSSNPSSVHTYFDDANTDELFTIAEHQRNLWQQIIDSECGNTTTEGAAAMSTDPALNSGPRWVPNQYHVYKVDEGSHGDASQYGGYAQLPLIPDELEPTLFEAEMHRNDQLFFDHQWPDRANYFRDRRNACIIQEAMKLISELNTNNSYSGAIWIPSRQVVLYNSSLTIDEVKARFEKDPIQMPTLEYDDGERLWLRNIYP